MTKHRHSRRHTRRHISRSRKMRGGSYTSASTYGAYVNGTPDSQFSRTFDATGPYASRAGSEYVGAQGQWSQQQNVPTAQNLSLIQTAGRRRKNRRGGFFGEVINQAIVPLGLLGLQQTYRKKRYGGKKSRKHRR
jgi:hypothetical protein